MQLDDEIRAVERLIARERDGLALLAEDWARTARAAVVSGKSLVAVAAVGFLVGEVLRPTKPAGRARKLGFGGMLAGVAFSAFRTRYGSPWVIAEMAWRAWRSAKSRRDGSAAPAIGNDAHLG